MTETHETADWSGTDHEKRLRTRLSIGYRVQNDHEIQGDIAWVLMKFDEAMGELRRLRESGVSVVWPFAERVPPLEDGL